jgi:death-on-curing protein
MVKFLSIEDVKAVHDLVIDEFGGSKGIRSEALLDSAVARMNASFDGQDFYETIFDKAAALFESLCKNHPFLDGNKRTSFVSAVTFLEMNGYKTNFDKEKAEKFILKVATKKVEFKRIVKFFEAALRFANS